MFPRGTLKINFRRIATCNFHNKILQPRGFHLSFIKLQSSYIYFFKYHLPSVEFFFIIKGKQLVKDKCSCCYECALQENERCGEKLPSCADNLFCRKDINNAKQGVCRKIEGTPYFNIYISQDSHLSC